jgi:hypothetical protein
VKVVVSTLSHRLSDETCLSLAGYLIEHGAPPFRKDFHELDVDAYFDDIENEVPGGETVFELYRTRIHSFPKLEFKGGRICVKYLSKVCLGKDLRGITILAAKQSPEASNISGIFGSFFSELVEILGLLDQHQQELYDFKIKSLKKWVGERTKVLPSTNGQLCSLWEEATQLRTVIQPTSQVAAMPAGEFWKLIEKIDRGALERGDQELAVGPLVSALSKISVAKLKSFHNQLTNLLYALDTRAHSREADTLSDDWFLYARCYVIAQGPAYYQSVLNDPKKMPRNDISFEYLLEAAPEAWAVKTGNDAADFPECSQLSYESGSNRDGWTQSDLQ